MALLSNELFLHGTCDLNVGGQKIPFVNCHLNLSDQQLHCYFEDDRAFLHSRDDGPYTLKNLALSSPSGPLYCSEVTVAFAGASRGGGWSSTTTTISHLLALNSKIASISFVINEPIAFNVDSQEEERLFFPGFDIGGSVQTAGSVQITGAKGYVAVSNCPADDLVASTSLGIAIGAPVREFAHLADGKLTLILNNYGSPVTPRPMVDMGWPWRDLDLSRRNVAELFDCCTRYLTGIDANSRSGFRDAVVSYLQARTLAGSYELKMLAAYHFLEWLDGSRTLSRDAVADALSVSKAAAKAICGVRNNLSHNRGMLTDEIHRAVEIVQADIDPTDLARDHLEPTRFYMNYLFTLLGNALLRRVGYGGETRPYLPL